MSILAPGPNLVFWGLIVSKVFTEAALNQYAEFPNACRKTALKGYSNCPSDSQPKHNLLCYSLEVIVLLTDFVIVL